MTHFTKTQKITMVALITFGVFNPMSYQILKDYIELVFNGIAILSIIWVLGFLLYKVLKPENVNIPKEAKNTTPKYIEE